MPVKTTKTLQSAKFLFLVITYLAYESNVEEKEIYWFHPDHLGSSSFITGLDGEVTEEFTPGFKTSLQSKSGMPDAGDNWEIIYFGTDTQFSASDGDIITEKFDKFRMNNFRKNFRQQREIRDLKSQKKPSILDIYKKPKDNLQIRILER